MKTPLDHVLRHNTWANGTLLDFCRSLDPVRLDDQARGTYGSLYGTLQHLVGAEQWYVQLITGELIGAAIRRDERRTLDELARRPDIVAQLTKHRMGHISPRRAERSRPHDRTPTR